MNLKALEWLFHTFQPHGNYGSTYPHLSVDITLFSADDIVRNASTRDESSPFLGGSTTTTSDPISHERGA